jgi:hypothetical protein
MNRMRAERVSAFIFFYAYSLSRYSVMICSRPQPPRLWPKKCAADCRWTLVLIPDGPDTAYYDRTSYASHRGVADVDVCVQCDRFT